MPSLGGWEFVILIGILVLLFGAKRLPDMARSIGQSARVFKGEMKGMKSDEAAKPEDKPADSSTASTPQALPEAKTRSEVPAQEKTADPARASQPGSGSSPQ